MNQNWSFKAYLKFTHEVTSWCKESLSELLPVYHLIFDGFAVTSYICTKHYHARGTGIDRTIIHRFSRPTPYDIKKSYWSSQILLPINQSHVYSEHNKLAELNEFLIWRIGQFFSKIFYASYVSCITLVTDILVQKFCTANQWTGFYMIEISVMKELIRHIKCTASQNSKNCNFMFKFPILHFTLRA